MNRSRWGIYLALREAGIDTSLGFKGRQRSVNGIKDFLDNSWMSSSLPRSPKQIAEHLNVRVESVQSVLRNRRHALNNRAKHVPIEHFLEGFVYYVPDPYKNLVRFCGEGEDGKELQIEMTPPEMEEAIRRTQDVS